MSDALPPFVELPRELDRWPALIAGGQPVVRVERRFLGPPRPGWPAPIVVSGFAYCTQGLARLELLVDGRPVGEPFHGLPRPDLAGLLGLATALSGFRGELLGLDDTARELTVIAVAPDGRAARWLGPLELDDDEHAPPPSPALPPLEPAPRRRADGESPAGAPPAGPDGWRQLAESWAERALRLEAAHEAAGMDRSWAGLQARLAIEQAAERALARRADELRPIAFPPAAEPLVSVVVTVHDGAAVTRRCLRALAASADTVAFEVVLVDDGDDPEVTRLIDAVEGATVLRNATNLGYTRSANRGALAARGTHIALLNNDTEPQPGWLDALVARLEDDPATGVVVAKLLFPDGRLQEAGSIIWADGTGWNYGIGDDETDPRYCTVREVDYGSAAALLVRGSLWRELGGFDERFAPAYYEDTDLCFAARERGLRVVYEPAARVVHARGGSMGAQSERLIEANRAVFRAKWGAALARQPAYAPELIDAAAARRAGR